MTNTTGESKHIILFRKYLLTYLAGLAIFSFLLALQTMPANASIYLVPCIAILAVTISYTLSPAGLYLASAANLISAAIVYRQYIATPEKIYSAFLFLLLLSTLSAVTLAIIKKREKKSIRNLEWISAVDCLTGAYNHRYFQHRLAEEISRAARNNGKVSLAFIDVDNFKAYNDQNGHIMGDMILKKISQFLKKMTREHDIVCRYGGDEFVIIFPEINANNTASIINRLVDSFPHHIKPAHIIDQAKLTLSIGISDYPDTATDINELIQKADQALYFVKNNGKNHVMIYDEMMPAKVTEKSNFCYDTCEKDLVDNYHTTINEMPGNEELFNTQLASSNSDGNGKNRNQLIVGKALILCHAGIDPLQFSINLDDLKLH